MAARTVTLASRSPWGRRAPVMASPVILCPRRLVGQEFLAAGQRRGHNGGPPGTISPVRGFVASLRRSWKSKRSRPVGRKQAGLKEKELELIVNVCIEEELPDDPEVLVIPSTSYHFFLFVFNSRLYFLFLNYVSTQNRVLTSSLGRRSRADLIQLMFGHQNQGLCYKWSDASDTLAERSPGQFACD